jgi:phosphotriesterase-related protein
VAHIETLRGPIDAEDLGVTLMHEHVFVLTPELQASYDLGFDEDEQVDEAIRRLDELADLGVRSIVDLTVIGLGRRHDLVQRVAERTRLQIVAATGLYTYDDLPHWFSYRGPGTPLNTPEPMIDLFVGDITHGIAGTDVKAAILKCATDHQGVTPGVERVLRAVSQAHVQTGVPISTHTHAGTERGLEQIAIFQEEGVDLSRVVIGHSGDTTDVDYLERLLSFGVTLGMDRFGVDAYLSFDERVDTVAELCRRGHASHLVLSHDAACHIDWIPPEILAFMPRWHYRHIHEDVLPALRERGVSEDQIDAMLVDAPRRILSMPT